MKIKDILDILEAEILYGEDQMDCEIHQACGSDLMSDVLAFAHGQGMLLTGLVNPQVIRTAEMMDIKAIAFVRGKRPDEEIIKFAQQKDMILMRTRFPMYSACGRLYSNGLKGKEGCVT